MIASFDGVDGAGKTSLIEALATNLTYEGYDVLTHHFSMGDDAFDSKDPLKRAPVYFDAIRSVYDNKLLPHVESGDKAIVLLDRYKWTTYTYNLWGPLEGDKEKLKEWVNIIKNDLPEVDADFFLAVSFETCHNRKGELTEEEYQTILDGYISAKCDHGAFEFILDGADKLDQTVWLARNVIKSMMIRA